MADGARDRKNAREDLRRIVRLLSQAGATGTSATDLLTQILAAVDGIEPTIESIDLSNTQIQLNTDQLEALLTAISGYLNVGGTGLSTQDKQDALITAVGLLATETTLQSLNVKVNDISTEQLKYGKFQENGEQKLTVSNVAVSLTVPPNTVAAYITVEDADIRMRVGPTNPDATTGLDIKEGDVIKLGETTGADVSEVNNAKFIRQDATDGILNIIYYKRA